MKELINLFDSETRAMAYVQMELLGMLDRQKTFSKNEVKLKEILRQRLCAMVDAGEAMRELITKLINMDEFELLHVVDVEELMRSEKKEDRS